MKHEGYCHCGAIAFELEGEGDEAINSNCSQCHRGGGLLAFFPRDALMQSVSKAMLALLLCASSATAAECPPAGQSRESLLALKAAKFEVADPDARLALARGLVPCLSDPDPELRDGIAYEALAQWLRAGDLPPLQLRVVRDALYATLDARDEYGFAHPFAALVLSEVARTDRVQPWMTLDERATMVARSADYVRSASDYRGFDDVQGWRHAIAHGADWLMQLSLNPKLERAQLDAILAAIEVQAVPQTAHAYVFGEPERLARPLLFVAQRGVYSAEDWHAWFAKLVPRLGHASLAYRDSGWLARRHDLMAFLQALYVKSDSSKDARIAALKPAVVAALGKVP